MSEALKSRRESSWLLESEDFLQFSIGMFALLYAGKHVVVPPNTRPGTLELLSSAYEARCSCLASERLPDQPALPEAIDPDEAVIDLYTSGSTGEPKKVRKTLAQFEAEAVVLESQWGHVMGESVVVSTSPHQHIYGMLFRLFWPLFAGRTFDTVTCSHPGALRERMSMFRDAALVATPAQLSRLPELVDFPGFSPKPKIIFSSGGPLPKAAALLFHDQWGSAPVEVFGSTETGGVAWRIQGRREDSDLWSPFDGITVRQSESGALLLISPYLGMRPHEMEDRIEVMPGGRFRSLGRADRVVKIEEKRLSLSEMENHLDGHPWVAQAALLPLNGRRSSIGAVLVLNGEGRQRLAAEGPRAIAGLFRKFLSANYDTVLLPRYWRFLERMPLNERGKISNQALSDLFVKKKACFPAIVNRHVEDSRKVVLDLEIERSLAHFSGHFPEMAILPGVVQIDWAIRYAREYFHMAGKFSSLENVKFLALVLPGARLQLTLAWDSDSGVLEFTYANSRRRFSTGRIVFGKEE
ncbi:MAG: AMP-binding protein [Candidatus Accumulibacter sp.]|nr:AMP-binding protein [Accumulibacter sp.]